MLGLSWLNRSLFLCEGCRFVGRHFQKQLLKLVNRTFIFHYPHDLVSLLLFFCFVLFVCFLVILLHLLAGTSKWRMCSKLAFFTSKTNIKLLCCFWKIFFWKLNHKGSKNTLQRNLSNIWKKNINFPFWKSSINTNTNSYFLKRSENKIQLFV